MAQHEERSIQDGTITLSVLDNKLASEVDGVARKLGTNESRLLALEKDKGGFGNY